MWHGLSRSGGRRGRQTTHKTRQQSCSRALVGALAGGIGISVPAGKVGLKAKAKGNGNKWS